MAKQQKLTKSNLLAAIQQEMGESAPSRATLETTLDALTTVLHNNLKAGLVVEVPGLVRLKTVEKAASPAKQKKNPFTGQMMNVAAKPASKKVKASPVAALKGLFG